MSPEEFLEKLKDESRSGTPPDCHLFWGGFLSQWSPSPFSVKGVRFPTAEHYMMSEKAKFFGDNVAYEKVLATPYPKSAKEIGRAVRLYDDSAWSRVRYEIVVAGNLAKFTQNEILKSKLLDTADTVLVEASPYDTVWGIGLAEDDHRATNPLQWRGRNLLGFAIMDVRQRLR